MSIGAGFDEIIEAERAYAPADLFEVNSMLSHEERLLLHWATRAGNTSPDAVIDGGCFLGGSTLALGSGVLARGGWLPSSEVHAYDLFVYSQENEKDWVPEGFPFGFGESTLPVFEHQVRTVRPLITLHAGDIRAERWGDAPISVCFVDIAKSWDTGDAVWREFFPALVPGRSLVIQQDLVHWGHPWCAIVMELLADRFEYLGWVWYSSAVYRCVRSVDAADLPSSLLTKLSTAEMLALLDRAADRFGEPFAGSLRLSGAVVLGAHREYQAARDRVDEVRARYTTEMIPYIDEGYAYLDAWIDAVEAGTMAVR